ncbi:MAG: hypothetical protein K5839_03860 [Treponemataceae bacterium]|nr:hypothetical protein [Treponemataceae bacterium]
MHYHDKKKLFAVRFCFVLFIFSNSLTYFSCQSLPHYYKDGFGRWRSYTADQNLILSPYKKRNFKHKNFMRSYEDKDYTYRLGVDISRHDGAVDWEKVKASGRDFVILRIGWRGYETGILHVDENFHENIKGAQEAGFDIGVYVFSQALTEEEALEEAELVINELKDYEIQLPVVFDPEHIFDDSARTDDLEFEQFTRNAIVFCEKVKEAGYEPMIYANLAWQTYVLDLSQLQQYKMWYADYKKVPRSPYIFEFWQYDCFGKVPGINRKCDLDMWLIKKEK